MCVCVFKLLSNVTDGLDLAWGQSRQHNRVILSWHKLILNSSYCSWDAEVSAYAHAVLVLTKILNQTKIVFC